MFRMGFPLNLIDSKYNIKDGCGKAYDVAERNHRIRVQNTAYRVGNYEHQVYPGN